jgi:hypothetical protein
MNIAWSNMSESDLSKKVINALYPLDPMPVDNPRRPGTPDINFVEGWMELKYMPEWPRKASTLVKFPKFSTQQRVWLVKRSVRQGNCFVFLQVKNLYLLFEGGFAGQHFDRMTKDEMIKNALYVWDYFPGEGLMKWLN